MTSRMPFWVQWCFSRCSSGIGSQTPLILTLKFGTRRERQAMTVKFCLCCKVPGSQRTWQADGRRQKNDSVWDVWYAARPRAGLRWLRTRPVLREKIKYPLELRFGKECFEARFKVDKMIHWKFPVRVQGQEISLSFPHLGASLTERILSTQKPGRPRSSRIQIFNWVLGDLFGMLTTC